jgi:hypothetical protein
MTDRYPIEVLGAEDDNGTMPENVERLRQAVVGRRIVKAEKRQVEMPWYEGSSHTRSVQAFVITLDDGREVRLADSDDCCAFTALEAFLLHPDRVDHMIMGVGTTENYTRWHIYADWGDVLELTVGWSPGNPFYYGYGFSIDVVEK